MKGLLIVTDYVVDEIIITKDLELVDPLVVSKSKIFDIDEFDNIDFSKPIIFVVDIFGDSFELSAFNDVDKAEDCFKTIARHKFSNWDEYSAEDISSVLDNGYETTSNGSLCLSWATQIY